MIESSINWLLALIESWGYLGIFILMFLESSLFPLPSEAIIIPAGYLASQGKMSFTLIMLTSVSGTLCGALLNYFLARRFGKYLLLKFGKYLFIKPHHIEKVEEFFKKHGEISTFNGRLVPGIRQFIPIPAGLACMNLKRFMIYTTLGAAIWMFTLTMLGFIIGENQELVKEYLSYIIVVALALVTIFSIIYIWYKKTKKPL
ncbi:MAG: DedA family protein [Campylobacteraceae bacterium]